jgi:hypothetical protein
MGNGWLEMAVNGIVEFGGKAVRRRAQTPWVTGSGNGTAESGSVNSGGGLATSRPPTGALPRWWRFGRAA